MVDHRNIETHRSIYGTFSMLSGDHWICHPFRNGSHWSEDDLKLILPILRSHVRGAPEVRKNIIEVGAHIGTHTIPFSYETPGTVYAFEPQAAMYGLLQANVRQNRRSNILPLLSAVYHEASWLNLMGKLPEGQSKGEPVDYGKAGNFGGIGLGAGGELVQTVKLDDLDIQSVGMLFIDAQGAEPCILYGARRTIAKWRPIIIYEDNSTTELRTAIARDLSPPPHIFNFNIADFCAKLDYAPPQRVGVDNIMLVPG